jgi:hypothetical protein
MSEKYQPTEAQIAKVLEKYKPRQIAIAYLKASRRASQAETAFDLMSDINDFTLSAVTGDIEAAGKTVEKVAQRFERERRTNTQTNEKGKTI